MALRANFGVKGEFKGEFGVKGEFKGEFGVKGELIYLRANYRHVTELRAN